MAAMHEVVTDKIVSSLQAGIIPWQKQFTSVLPSNFKSKKEYRGINRLLTTMNAFKSPYWLTKKQAIDLGGTLKPAVDPTNVVFFTMLEDRRDAKHKFPFMRSFEVYNLEQIDGIAIPDEEVSKQDSKHPYSKVSNLALYMPNRPTIVDGHSRFDYNSMTDEVFAMKSAKKDDTYYSELFHQLAHSTGHPNRLKRFKKDDSQSIFENDSFGKEELVGEMASAFLCGHCGIHNTVKNPIGYVEGWIKTFSSDSRIVVQAANAAQKATDLIINKKD